MVKPAKKILNVFIEYDDWNLYPKTLLFNHRFFSFRKRKINKKIPTEARYDKLRKRINICPLEVKQK